MLHLIRNFKDRTEISVFYRNLEISSVLVKFHSEYNDHIWHDPIMWVAGNKRDSRSILDETDLENCILISQNKFEWGNYGKFKGIGNFHELIMGIENHNSDKSNNPAKVRQLNKDMAVESLHLSGIIDNENNFDFLVQREMKFISERICFGVVDADKLLSRGAIMSTTEKYSSVGAFFTSRDNRGKGFATLIIGKILEKASEYSKNSCLFVNSRNSAAISLYRKIGFEIIGEAYFTDFGTGLKP
jgi:ribosomal protein S18 acetylase RimI-like enzyme